MVNSQDKWLTGKSCTVVMHQEIEEGMTHTMPDIKGAIVGVGNCVSSFCQGIELLNSKRRIRL